MNKRKGLIKVLLLCLMMIFCMTGLFMECVPNLRIGTAPQAVLSGEQVSAMSRKNSVKLMPVGAAVGIHVKTDGLLVIGTAEVLTVNGDKVHPAQDDVKSGDYILKVNGCTVSEASEMIKIINEAKEENVILTLKRDREVFDIRLKTAKTGENEYKVGIWVRDDTQGIGTLSFVDEKNRFAALGHGITDIDTGEVINICSGGLYPANIYNIVKGGNDSPGEMIGQILYGKNQQFARIGDNTEEGIYGVLNSNCAYNYDEHKAVEVAFKEQVHVGKAYVRCQIDGVIEDYSVWISGVDFNGGNNNKDFVIEVKDERLLSATGGIVQGMSGSPIIQDNKIVGVVTHVFLNNPAKGYGIFIEKMLTQSQKIFTP